MRNYWRNLNINTKIGLPIIAFVIILASCFLYFYIYLRLRVNSINENIANTQNYLQANSLIYEDLILRLSVIGLVLGLMTVFLAVAFSVYLRKIITKPIMKLSETAEAITHGNFQVKIFSNSADELGILARNLASMSLKLSDYYHNLESQVIVKEAEIRRNKAFELQKDDFMNTASHELKTPITSLKIYSELMSRLANKNGHTEYVRYLTKIEDQVSKLTNLISSLLDITKMQSGMSFNMKSFDITKCVVDAIEVLKISSPTHEIILKGSTTKTVWGDANRIGQVVNNLLANAVKYSPGKQKVIVNVSERNHGIKVSIRDFGIGIDSIHQQKIFDKFYRVSDSDERTFPGLGIGLYICKEIIARHKGKLWVDSKKGEGSTFNFTIPYKEDYN